jgi:hypothetical protein
LGGRHAEPARTAETKNGNSGAPVPWPLGPSGGRVTGLERPGGVLAVASTAPSRCALVPSLWPAHDVAISNGWNFSVVRWARPNRSGWGGQRSHPTVQCPNG